MTVFENGVPGEAYNIGSGNECKNIDIIKMLIELVCTKKKLPFEKYQEALGNIKYVENARPGHDFRYSINHRKITNELGWVPKVGMLECLEKTVDWYLENQYWVENIKKRKEKA